MPYIGRDIRTGAFRQLDDISSGFDGSDTTHTMQVNSTNVSVGDVNQILLSLGGVIQKPGTDFTVSGSTLTFTTAPAANTSFFAILLGSDNGGTVTPTDGSVTGDKLASNIAIATTADASFGSKIGVNTTHPASGAGLDKFIEVQGGDPGVVLRDDTASDAVELYNAGGTFVAYTGSADAFKIDSNGHVTMPKQSVVQVRLAGTQSNVSDGDTVLFASERFDINSDFNTSNYTFTAPVTGKYLVCFVSRTQSLDADSSHVRYRFLTSNINYEVIKSPNVYTGDQTFSSWTFALICDFDANDTMTVTIDFSGGADQIDIDDQTFLSVNLVS